MAELNPPITEVQFKHEILSKMKQHKQNKRINTYSTTIIS